jgi:hypothetical protein
VLKVLRWANSVIVVVLALNLISTPAIAIVKPAGFVIATAPNPIVVKSYTFIQRASTSQGDPNPVNKWCFSISGTATRSLTGSQVYYSEYNGIDSVYWSDQKLVIDNSGCVTIQGGFNLGKTWLTLDVTNWLNGEYLLTSTITNSQGLTAAKQTSFTVRNPLPSISKSSGPEDMSTVSGKIRYDLIASPSQVSDSTYVTKWCLFVDGRGLGYNETLDAVSIEGYENPLQSTDLLSEIGCYTNHSDPARSITHGSLEFDTSKWTYGTHTVAIQVTNSEGFKTESSFRVVTAQSNQELAWLYPGDLYYFSSYFPYTGGTYEIRGEISEPNSVPRPHSIKIRTWQLKSGWTKWAISPVDSVGRFAKSYKVVSRMKVQVQIGAHGPIKTQTFSDVIPVDGLLRITAPQTAHYYQRITFKIFMAPKWSGFVSCSKTVTKNNWDYFSHPRIYLKNGIGTYTTVAGTDRITHIGLSCSAETNELDEALGGQGVNIF